MKSRFFNPLTLSRSPFALFATAISITLSGSLGAATITWDGGPATTGNLIGTAENWAGDVLPSVVVPDTAEWNGAVAGPLSLLYSSAAFAGVAGNAGINLNIAATQTAAINIDAGTNTTALRMNGLTVASGAGAFSLGDTLNAFNLTLGGGAGTHTWVNNSSNPVTIGSEIVWGLGGGAAHTLAVGGSGNWNFNNIMGQGTGILTVTKNGTGIANLNGANVYTGGTNVENGTIRLTSTNTSIGQFSAGTVAAQNGILEIDGGTLNANKTTIPSLAAGTVAGSNGFIKMSAGTIATVSELHLGRGTGSYSAMSVAGGTVTSGNWLVVGLAGDRAVLNQSGGSFTVAANRMTVGAGGSTSIGVANFSGGTFTSNVGIFVGENGTGTVNVSGTAVTNMGDLRFANNATSLSGIFNLLGGTVNAASISKGPGTASGVFLMNFNGGILKPTATNATFFADLDNTSAYVYAGGARIDTNTFNATIGEPLLAPSGNGVATPAITTGGAGYVDTPIVTITRGAADITGVGATAIATVAGGVVTGITITNPGIGYTDIPVFTLVGGGAATQATVTGSAPVPNVSGGLAKTGAGILTLNAASTFTGQTLVSEGTLTLSGTGAVNSSSGITINGPTAKLIQTSGTNISSPVTLTQGSIDGTATLESVTVANLAANTLDAGIGTSGTLTINTLKFQGAASLNVTAIGAFLDRSFQTNELTTNAAGKVVINATNASGVWQPGDYPVIYYNTSFTGSLSDFTVGSVPGLSSHQTASIVDIGGAITLHIQGDSLTWTGNQNANWTTAAVGGNFNWFYPSVNEKSEFANGESVIFDDSAKVFAVNLGSNVSPGTTIFDNSNNDYVLSTTGSFGINGGSLVKNGSGLVTLLTTNTYTGATTINDGTLQIGNGTTDGSIATSGSISTNGSSSLIFNLTGSQTYANPIGGAATATITKTGSGALTLSGANTFASNLVLEAGALNFNSPTALGTGTGVFTVNGGSINNTSGAAIVSTSNKPQAWNTDLTFAGTSDLAMGTGVVTIGGTAGSTRTITISAGTLGTGPLNTNNVNLNVTKSGSGALRLSGGSPVINGTVNIASGLIGTAEDFFADGLTGPGTFENGTANTKWSFWNIVTDQTTGTLIQNGGGTGLLGLIKRGAGTWTLTNNGNNATANLTVDLGKLILNNTGTYGAGNAAGAVATNLTSVIGNTAAQNGVLEINGATVNYNNVANADALAYRGTLSVGNNATGAGALHLGSGLLTVYRQLSLGNVAGAFGGYSQSGGTTTVGGFLAIGLGTASGVFNQNAGTFTMSTAPVTNAAGTGSFGVMSLSGSAEFNQNPVGDLGIWLGENGTGTLNVSGNAALTFAATNNGLQLGRNAAGIGTANLVGGNVVTARVAKGAGTGTLNFNGGMLTANAASTTFLTGLTNTFVHAGGGTINNGGNAITIGQALLAPTGSGVSATGLTVSGAGFIDTPIVRITGDGTGASAVAVIDGAGNLTGITITSPGSGYTTAPVFSLIGGGIGNTGLISGTASLITESAGNMAFSGTGLTTLTGANTYQGNTTVGTGSILSLAQTSSTLFVPKANGVSNKITGAGTAAFYGAFTLDLTGAALASGNSWTLVDVANKTYDALTFNVVGFTKSGDTWTKVDGANSWTFSQTTGVLSLQTSGMSGYAAWAAANAGSGSANGDFDHDGVSNGVEYFMGASGSSFTTNPSLLNGTITWPKDPAYSGTYTVQTSPNLVTWSNVTATVVGNTVQYTPATGQGKVFVRLVVTPN